MPDILRVTVPRASYCLPVLLLPILLIFGSECSGQSQSAQMANGQLGQLGVPGSSMNANMFNPLMGGMCGPQEMPNTLRMLCDPNCLDRTPNPISCQKNSPCVCNVGLVREGVGQQAPCVPINACI